MVGDGYKRPLVNSLSSNLQPFGMEKVSVMESLQEIIDEMTESVGHKTRTIYSRYAICDESMLKDAAQKIGNSAPNRSAGIEWQSKPKKWNSTETAEPVTA